MENEKGWLGGATGNITVKATPIIWNFDNSESNPVPELKNKKYVYLSPWDDPDVNPFIKFGILDKDGKFTFSLPEINDGKITNAIQKLFDYRSLLSTPEFKTYGTYYGENPNQDKINAHWNEKGVGYCNVTE